MIFCQETGGAFLVRCNLPQLSLTSWTKWAKRIRRASWLKGCRFGARDSDGPEESRFRSAKFGEKPNESICCFENVVPFGK